MLFLDWITRILGLMGGIIAVYLFIENRRLRIFNVDEQLEQLKIKEEEIEEECNRKKQEISRDLNIRGLTPSNDNYATADKWKEMELKKITVRRKHLVKIKKYKWLWRKVD